MDGYIIRYCKSCDICLRIIGKGNVIKGPLGELPVIYIQFKMVVMDVAGPIFSVPESENIYFLTIVDYANLRNILAIDVA